MKGLSKLGGGEAVDVWQKTHYRPVSAVCILCVVSESTVSCDFYYLTRLFSIYNQTHYLIRVIIIQM